jgi:hypothetical protein
MTARTITLEVFSDAQEEMARRSVELVQELESVADAAAHGQVLDDCEQAALLARDEFAQRLLAGAVQRRIDAAEKKGA